MDAPAVNSVSMSRRLSFGLASAITVVLAIVVGGYYLTTEARLERNFAQKAEQIQSYLNGTLAPLLWNFDHDTVAQVSRTILRDDLVVQVTIRDGRKQSVFSKQQTSGKPDLILARPVKFNDRRVGELVVGFTRAPMRNELEGILWSGVSVWLILVLTIVSLNAVLIRKFLRGPLASFIELTKAYRENPESPPSTETQFVEFRPIEEVVKQLANDVYRHFKQEQESEAKYRERLEKQVEARTTELNTANERLSASNRELSENRAKYQDLYENSPDCLMLVDVATFRVVECNSRMTEMLGVARNDVIGRNLMEIYADASHEGAAKALQELETTGHVHGVELKVKRADGSVIDVLLDSVGFLDPEGQLTMARSSWTDISQRKKFEKDLQDANRRLAELDQMKSMFIASVSHELRTPLNAIIGFSGLVLSGMSGELNEEQQDSMERVNRTGKHLLALISDVIDISKIEAGGVDRFLNRFSLKDVVTEAADGVRPELASKGLDLKIDAPSWPRMYSDQKHLLQCLLNILSNAVKFTETGSITISVRMNANLVRVSVKDTGIGISEDDIGKLFAPFERLESDLRVKAGGTGLGLYLVKKVATDVLEGDVSVESRLGMGSVFSLHIPREIGGTEEGAAEETKLELKVS